MPVSLSPAGAPVLRPSRASIDDLIDREVAAVRRAVLETRYPHDPVLGSMSRTSSLAASLVRRHGLLSASLLTQAIDILADGELDVLVEYPIPLTRVARDIVRANAGGRAAQIDLPAEGAFDGIYRADCIVISERLSTAWIVEIKRANAEYGRKLVRPLKRLEVARLSASPILRGAYRVSRIETVLISLYGESAQTGVLLRADLDKFFGLDLQSVLGRLDHVYAAMAGDILGACVRKDMALFGSDEIAARQKEGKASRERNAAEGEGVDMPMANIESTDNGADVDPPMRVVRPADLFRVRAHRPIHARERERCAGDVGR